MATEVGSHTFHLYQARTFDKTIKISGISTITGYSVRLMLKRDKADSTALLTLSSPSSGITLNTNGSQLLIAIVITVAQASAVFEETTDKVYLDLEVTHPDSKVKSYIEGDVILHRVVTR